MRETRSPMPSEGPNNRYGRPRSSLSQRLATAMLVALSLPITAMATEPDRAMQLEVEQLLLRLGASGCQFQRNGSWYGAVQARKHLEQKYRYLLDRQLVLTTEDFISLAATKSSISGNAYLVQCSGQPQIYSADWMTAKLREIRAARAPLSTDGRAVLMVLARQEI